MFLNIGVTILAPKTEIQLCYPPNVILGTQYGVLMTPCSSNLPYFLDRLIHAPYFPISAS